MRKATARPLVRVICATALVMLIAAPRPGRAQADTSGELAARDTAAQQRLGMTDRESTQLFEEEPLPPAGSPNVIYIVLDDVGFSDLGAFGSEIDTRNIDRIAAEGLRYTNFHTQAVCSPTRAALLTGRNAHTVGTAGVPGTNNGFPSGQGRITPAAATVAEALQSFGYRTYAVGKWHLAAMMQTSTRAQWPLGRGFDQYYGFLGAMTDQYRPELVRDNTPLPQPDQPGYHLSEDLTEKAIDYIATEQAVSPERPFFLYLAYGAAHSPHQVPKPFVDKYAGMFAKGWDRVREDRFARQKREGIIPGSAALPPGDPAVKAWDTLTDDQKSVYARLQATYAGFVDHTDKQIGRLLDYLDRADLRKNTIIVLISDNGASSSGGENGSLNDLRALSQRPMPVSEMIGRLDEFGGETTYQHYPKGWAQASNTPFRFYKVTNWEGGTRSPLVISWPKGIAARGETRNQFVSSIDISPTILGIVGTRFPERYKGVSQLPVAGASFAATLTDRAAPPPRSTQFFETLGQRAIWHDGWTAIAAHTPGTDYETDRWALFDTAADPTQTRDLSAQQPLRLRAMIARWWAEAGKYGVLPLADSPVTDTFKTEGDPTAARAVARYKFNRDQRPEYQYFPGTGTLLRQEAPTLTGPRHEFTVVTRPLKGSERGVLVASGDAFGGYVLFVGNEGLVFTFNDLGSASSIRAPASSLTGATSIGYAFTRKDRQGGTGTLLINGRAVAKGEIASPDTALTALSNFDIGRDGGGHVSAEYPASGDAAFPAEMIETVTVTTGAARQ